MRLLSAIRNISLPLFLCIVTVSCSKDKTIKKSVPKVIIEAQASINLTEVKQTIEGFGGASIPI